MDSRRTPFQIGGVDLERGAGGETHQTTRATEGALTTQQGVPVADAQNSLKAGPRGPLLMDDFHFREKLFHFDHERIPNGWSMRGVSALMACSRPPRRSPT